MFQDRIVKEKYYTVPNLGSKVADAVFDISKARQHKLDKGAVFSKKSKFWKTKKADS